ncbi:MAG TPA: hypothetical protein VN873_02855 [Candidatus Angelobacter sp.]|nr:hypothetical protein [Candidatus Angelobacter sp.]
MNIQSLVAVILRLLALDFLYWSILSMLELAEKIYSYEKESALAGMGAWIVVPWLVIVLLVVAEVLLWIFAPAIARLVSRGVPQDISLGALTLADCYSVAFIGVGLMCIANRLPQAITWAHYLLRSAASNSTDVFIWGQLRWYDIVQVAIGLTIGIVLFVNGRKWSVSLARRDTAGSLPATPEDKSGEGAA